MNFLAALFGSTESQPVQVYNAVKASDISRLQRLLGSLPDRPDPGGPIALLEARDKFGKTPLCVAARLNNMAIIDLLCKKGAYIHACSQDREGGTALHEAISVSANEAAHTLLRYGANPFSLNRHLETAYDIAMRRGNVTMLRAFEQAPGAKFAGPVQVKESKFLGFSGEYQERHVVLVPREPLEDINEQSARVIHSQLLIFGNNLDAQPRCKVWADGARMTLMGDKYHLKLHHTHSKPINVRIEVDEANLFCVCFRASAVPGYGDYVHRLASTVNSLLRQAHGHCLGGVGANSSNAVASHPVPQSPHTANNSASGPVQRPNMTPQPSGGMSPSPSAPPAVSAAAAAAMVGSADANGASTSGSNGGAGSGVYNVSGVAPSAPSTLPPRRDSSAAADEELAARLQQSELLQARMTDSDLQAQMSNMRPAHWHPGSGPLPSGAAPTGSKSSAATPPVPPPAGARKSSQTAAAASRPPELDDDQLCVICQEQRKTTGFKHAGTLHLCACRACAEQWYGSHGKCPVCSQRAEMLVEVYS